MGNYGLQIEKRPSNGFGKSGFNHWFDAEHAIWMESGLKIKANIDFNNACNGSGCWTGPLAGEYLSVQQVPY